MRPVLSEVTGDLLVFSLLRTGDAVSGALKKVARFFKHALIYRCIFLLLYILIWCSRI